MLEHVPRLLKTMVGNKGMSIKKHVIAFAETKNLQHGYTYSQRQENEKLISYHVNNLLYVVNMVLLESRRVAISSIELHAKNNGRLVAS